MDAYACWLLGLTGTDGAWRGDLYQLLNAMQERNAAAQMKDLVRDLYQMDEGALLCLLHEALPASPREPRLLEQIVAGRKEDPEHMLQSCVDKGIRCAAFYEEDFPQLLRQIPDPPLGLFWKGRLPEAERPALSIIGARLSSPYGRQQAREFALELARNGIQIVSGMARGIDGIAGSAALEVSDDSFAVLGCGVDICYPAENEQLYSALVERGGIISEFWPGTPAVRYHFPQRNRIIAGLTQAVLVIEAREKSGTLITVDMAVEQGRDIFALPGRVSDRTSHGCNALIRQGAFPATSPDDLLTYYYSETPEHVRMRNRTREAVPEELQEETRKRRQEREDRKEREARRRQDKLDSMGKVEQTVYALLDESTPSVIDALVDPVRERLQRRVSFSELMRAMTALLMAGLVRELRVGNYIRIS